MANINKPISLLGVASLLGVEMPSAQNVCSSLAINNWARYKPFRHNLKTFASDEDYYAARVAKNFGLDITRYTGLTGLNSMLTAVKKIGKGNTAWTLEMPRGSSYSECYRVFDFDRYYAQAPIPRKLVISPEVVFGIDGNTQYLYSEMIPSPGIPDECVTENSLTESVGSFEEKHIGIFWRNPNDSSDWGVKTFGEVVSRASLSGLGLTAGVEYDAVIFYAPDEIDGRGVSPSMHFYATPIPYYHLGRESSWGLTFYARGTDVTQSNFGLSLSATAQTVSGGMRRITNVRMCHRESGHYRRTDLTLPLYTITENASGDNEWDSTFRIFGQDYIELPNGVSTSCGPSRVIPKSVSLPGLDFVQFTHQRQEGSTWVDDTTYTLQVSIIHA